MKFASIIFISFIGQVFPSTTYKHVRFNLYLSLFLASSEAQDVTISLSLSVCET